MVVHADLVQCPSPACRGDGARYRRRSDDEALLALGAAASPEPVPLAADTARLRRGVWRYTLLPGLIEVALAERLRRIENTTVELWPERDKYDLRVATDGHMWMVDVKDWSSAPALARHLSRIEPPEPLHIVVPAQKEFQIRVLRDRCRNANFVFCTDRQFADGVRARATSQRSRQ
jgi:hypothetical protein